MALEQQKLAYVPSTSLQYSFKEALPVTGQVFLDIKSLPKEFFKRKIYLAAAGVSYPATHQLKGRIRLYNGGQITLEIPYQAKGSAAAVPVYGFGAGLQDTAPTYDGCFVQSSGGFYSTGGPIVAEGIYDAADFLVEFYASAASMAILFAIKSILPFPS